MASENKRINLTVTPELYERIQEYRKKNGCPSDSGACLQLISQRLNDIKESEQLMEFVKMVPVDKLVELSAQGVMAYKETLGKKEPKP